MKIIVVGAGVIGQSCAWRLASAGAQVEVLDSRAVGHGATLAALGALWPASPLSSGPLQMLHRKSLWQFEEFARGLSVESRREISFRRLGRMEILNSVKAAARARQEAAAAIAQWPAFGGALPTMEVVDFTAAERINSGMAGGKAFSYGALLCRATAQVKVNELMGALAEACRGRGVIFHERRAVTGLVRAGSRVVGVETSAGRMPADLVLIAAGAWTRRIAPEVADCVPVLPAKGEGLAVTMPASRPLATILKSGSIYLIPWDDEVLIGSTTEPEAGFDETPTMAAREKLLAGAAALVPALAEMNLLRHWAGLRPASEDNLPVMGPVPSVDGLFVCAGHYKTGIGLAPLVSQLMSEVILQNTITPDLQPFLPRTQ